MNLLTGASLLALAKSIYCMYFKYSLQRWLLTSSRAAVLKHLLLAAKSLVLKQKPSVRICYGSKYPSSVFATVANTHLYSKYLATLVSICYRRKYPSIAANTHMNLPLSLSLPLSSALELPEEIQSKIVYIYSVINEYSLRSRDVHSTPS